MAPGYGIEISERSFDPGDMRFQVAESGGKVAIQFLLMSDEELDDGELGQIAYLALDGLLGEWDVEINVGAVGRRRILTSEAWPVGALGHVEAREAFDRLIAPLRKPQ
jgi:hypothetical protein